MQTRAGAKKARETMIAKYGGEDGYREHLRTIGSQGGKLSGNGGFASEKIGKDGLTGKQRAAISGAKGGRNGKRGKQIIEVQDSLRRRSIRNLFRNK